MVGYGENVFVAAAAHVHHDKMVARQGRGDLGDMGERVRRFECRDDPFLPAAQLEGVERLAVGDRNVLDAAEVVQPLRQP